MPGSSTSQLRITIRLQQFAFGFPAGRQSTDLVAFTPLAGLAGKTMTELKVRPTEGQVHNYKVFNLTIDDRTVQGRIHTWGGRWFDVEVTYSAAGIPKVMTIKELRETKGY